MALIDATYFVNDPRCIPNVNATSYPAGASIAASVLQYINTYEPDFLKKLFGEDLYDDYVATSTATRWTAVKALLYNGTTKVSVIADYIYYRWLEDHQHIGTMGGDKQSEDATMTANVNVPLLVNTWRRIHEQVKEVVEYLNDNSADFPLFDGGSSADYYFDMVNPFDI